MALKKLPDHFKEVLNLGISGRVSVEEVSLQIRLPQGFLAHRAEVVRLVCLPNLIIDFVFREKIKFFFQWPGH